MVHTPPPSAASRAALSNSPSAAARQTHLNTPTHGQSFSHFPQVSKDAPGGRRRRFNVRFRGRRLIILLFRRRPKCPSRRETTTPKRPPFIGTAASSRIANSTSSYSVGAILNNFLKNVEMEGRRPSVEAGVDPPELRVQRLLGPETPQQQVESSVVKTKLLAEAARDSGMKISDDTLAAISERAGPQECQPRQMRAMLKNQSSGGSRCRSTT